MLRFLVFAIGIATALCFPAAGQGPIEGNPLVEIPAGVVPVGDGISETNEATAQPIPLPAFRTSKFEITNSTYNAFVGATGYRRAFYANHPILGLPSHPVVGVSWDDADAFCRHYGLKLPTELQWERAARGAEGRLYAWGNDPPTPTRANRGADRCCAPNRADGFSMTAPVGTYPAGRTPEGVMDMTGNVWEWVDGWYEAGGVAASNEARFRVLRGGAWNSDEEKLRASYRMAYDGDFRYAANGGFRCVGN